MTTNKGVCSAGAAPRRSGYIVYKEGPRTTTLTYDEGYLSTGAIEGIELALGMQGLALTSSKAAILGGHPLSETVSTA